MVHATKFLLRWLYLNNLIHDRAEIQSLPYLHPSQIDMNMNMNHHHPHNQPPPDPPHPSQHNPHENHQNTNLAPQPQPQPQNPIKNDIEWKRKALRKIALYPPGTSRLLALDSLRLEIVHELAKELHDADGIIQDYNRKYRRCKLSQAQAQGQARDTNTDTSSIGNGNSNIDIDFSDNDDDTSSYSEKMDSKFNLDGNYEKSNHQVDDDGDGDEGDVLNLDSEQESESDLDSSSDLDDNNNNNNIMDESTSIINEFEKATSSKIIDNPTLQYPSSIPTSTTTSTKTAILDPILKQALELQRETRDYLPQFVSAILHSPPSLTTTYNHNHHHHHHQNQHNYHHHQQQHNTNPISTLRNLLMNRCVRDPNLGIELCWLLEAEVGRAWKSLFEHRQQNGRIILIYPADKAAVIAKIGIEKRSAFDLLQDVECATAFGYVNDHVIDYNNGGEGSDYYYHHHNHHGYDNIGSTSTSSISDPIFNTPRLPASLSMKRCSHFGDTMNFIDHLTQISLKLRHLPICRRDQHLKESLEELNRRLRRRMITEGNVSLDVEDNLGPYDWPSVGDVSLKSLKYSVHLPLEPIVRIIHT